MAHQMAQEGALWPSSVIRAGRYTNLEMVQYFIKYYSINNYHGILINTFMYQVKCSNNFSQVTSV